MMIEHRLQNRNQHLMAMLTLMSVAYLQWATVAAIGEKNGKFESVTAKRYRQYQPDCGSWKG